MASLDMPHCGVTLNLGVRGAEILEGELEKVFPQESRTGCSLKVSYDLNDEVLYLDINPDTRENLMMISIDGLNEIDALRRYCEMVIEHHKEAAK